jgi:hypothetical protein
MEVPLASSKDDVDHHLEMLGNAVGTSVAYLKRQINAREAKASSVKFTYPSIGPAFRAKDGRNLKKTPSNGEDKVEYLKNLMLQMMKADSRRGVITDENPTLNGLVRSNPVINLASTDPISIRAKQQQ